MANVAKLAHVDSVHSSNRGTMDVIESREQFTLIAAETIEEGALVAFNSVGKVVNCEADSATALSKIPKGIAVRKALAGEAVTVLRDGDIGGFDLSLTSPGDSTFIIGAPLYSSNTAGAIATQTAPGTGFALIGEIIPLHVGSPGASSAPAKAVRISISSDPVVRVDAT
jgi:hypothetical protein